MQGAHRRAAAAEPLEHLPVRLHALQRPALAGRAGERGAVEVWALRMARFTTESLPIWRKHGSEAAFRWGFGCFRWFSGMFEPFRREKLGLSWFRLSFVAGRGLRTTACADAAWLFLQ